MAGRPEAASRGWRLGILRQRVIMSYVGLGAIDPFRRLMVTAWRPSHTVDVVEALAWPVVALVGICILAWLSRKANDRGLPGILSAVASRVRRVNAFGVELELNAESAARVRATIEEVFGDYRNQINRAFDRLVRIHGVTEAHQRTVDAAVAVLNDEAKDSYRSTLYVRDALFLDRLYQLVDYHPRGRGRGRTFSVRYGIVGRAWRLDRDQLEEDVPPTVEELVTKWGMTREEAAGAGHGHRSFAAVVLRNSTKHRVGLLYIDAEPAGAFSDRAGDPHHAVPLAIRKAADETGLVAALTELGRQMAEGAPEIRLPPEED